MIERRTSHDSRASQLMDRFDRMWTALLFSLMGVALGAMFALGATA